MRKSVLRRLQVILGAFAILTVVAPSPAQAQIRRVSSSDDWRQAIGFKIGYFVVKGEDSRGEDDVLFRDLDSLLFDIGDFNGATFGAEWLIGVTDYIEVGAGINYYQASVPSIYRFLENADGSEIEQELKLRQSPMSATVRFLPIGRRNDQHALRLAEAVRQHDRPAHHLVGVLGIDAQANRERDGLVEVRELHLLHQRQRLVERVRAILDLCTGGGIFLPVLLHEPPAWSGRALPHPPTSCLDIPSPGVRESDAIRLLNDVDPHRARGTGDRLDRGIQRRAVQIGHLQPRDLLHLLHRDGGDLVLVGLG